jgi:hypothetical protein
MATDSFESYQFVTNFRATLAALGSKVTFEPKYKFRDLRGQVTRQVLEANCYTQGKYCATDPEESADNNHKLIYEAIRQICLWDRDKRTGDSYWWTYIQAYQTCLRDKQRGSYLSKPCYIVVRSDWEAFKAIEPEINKCMDTSFDNQQEPFKSENKLLLGHSNPPAYEGLYLVPAMLINGRLVKGEVGPVMILSAICDVLAKKPKHVRCPTDDAHWRTQLRRPCCQNDASHSWGLDFAGLNSYLRRPNIYSLLRKQTDEHANYHRYQMSSRRLSHSQSVQ